VEFLRLMGLGYKEMVARGAHFPLTEMSIRFRKPLRFDDLILVETKVNEISETRLSFSYRIILNEVGLIEGKIAEQELAGKELVEARTEHCCVNNAGRPMPIPKDIGEKIISFRV
jgi:acyl-CoA thioester hydrolase